MMTPPTSETTSDATSQVNQAPLKSLTPHLECVSCLVRQAQEAIVLASSNPTARETALRNALRFLAGLDWSQSAPRLGQQMHCFIRQEIGNPDPYASVKTRLNERALQLHRTWRRRFRRRYGPLEAAVRLAIVGNLLDMGAKTQLSDDAVLATFENALTAPLLGSMESFSAAIREARHILYLADNAGEIVFDRDLLALLPLGNFALAVRGGPVLNDATLADAHWAGLSNLCEIVPNGSDAPGTFLDDCSPEFCAHFAAADLVIAKGQGNFETLADVDKPIFFLFNVKCDVLSRTLGCPRGSLVLRQSNPNRKDRDHG